MLRGSVPGEVQQTGDTKSRYLRINKGTWQPGTSGPDAGLGFKRKSLVSKEAMLVRIRVNL